MRAKTSLGRVSRHGGDQTLSRKTTREDGSSTHDENTSPDPQVNVADCQLARGAGDAAAWELAPSMHTAPGVDSLNGSRVWAANWASRAVELAMAACFVQSR